MASLFLAYPLVTESPRWLLTQKGRTYEAKDILNKIAKINNKPEPQNLYKRLNEINDWYVALEQLPEGQGKEVVKRKLFHTEDRRDMAADAVEMLLKAAQQELAAADSLTQIEREYDKASTMPEGASKEELFARIERDEARERFLEKATPSCLPAHKLRILL